MTIRVNFKKIFEIIFIIMLIPSVNSIFSLTRGNALFSYTIVALAICLSFDYKNIKIWMKLFRKPFLIYICFLMFPFFLMEAGYTFYIKFIIFIPLTILLFVTKSEDKKEEFWIMFSDVVFFFGLISLFFWILGPNTNILHSTGVVDLTWGRNDCYVSYYGIAFSPFTNYKYIFGLRVLTNTWIYAESPMTGFVFALGFCTRLLLTRGGSKIKTIIYFIIVLSTISANAIMVSLIIMTFSMWQNILIILRKIKRNYPIIIGLTFIVILGIYYVIRIILTAKMQADAINFASHLNALFNSINNYRNNIWTGIGYGSQSIDGNTTSGLGKVLTQGGTFFGVLYLLPFAVLFWHYFRENRPEMFFWTGTFLVLLTLVLCQYSTLILTFLAFGYSQLDYTKRLQYERRHPWINKI